MAERGAASSILLPGLPQLLAGRWGAGTAALMLWAGMWWVLIARWERVTAAASGAWDEKLALATVAAALVGSWTWSWRDARRAGAEAAKDVAAAEDSAGGKESAAAQHVAAATEDVPATEDGVSQWTLAARAFSRNRTAVTGLLVIVALYAIALVTPLVAPYDPNAQLDLVTQRFLPPSPEHLLGTDQYARDVLSRLLYGARISLVIGFVAAGVAVTIGTTVGAVAGYAGGVVDTFLMRFVDMVLSFPRLVLLITIIALFEPSIFLIIAVLGLTLWPSTARLVRAEVLGLREREFVQAAVALGFSKRRIVLQHLIPNALAPVIVAATLGIGNTIVLEAGLSFLGLGVQPPTASWGSMVDEGRVSLLGAWWVSTFPGLAIVFTVLSFNLVGDGLRDALDPRMRT